jgi:hypothetical protein
MATVRRHAQTAKTAQGAPLQAGVGSDVDSLAAYRDHTMAGAKETGRRCETASRCTDIVELVEELLDQVSRDARSEGCRYQL